ncbi:MAG: T9SS C-terminal target domain-containing protein [Gemmatimonadetes bacterium]|nr:MAG: T9SS C-terminal target domain-containing protein [Gemmatimonadota bacterium]
MRYFAILFGVITALVIMPVAQAQEVLYEDHFGEPGGDCETQIEWGSVIGGNTVQPFFFADQTPDGEFCAGELTTVDANGGIVISGGGEPTLEDYRVEAWVYTIVDAGTTAPNNGIVARARYDDVTENLYGYILCSDFDQNTDNNAPRIRLLLYNGVVFPSTIAQWSGDDIPGGAPTESGWHKFTLQVEGDQLWAWYDDELLAGCPYTDSSLSQGLFGVYAFDFMQMNATYVDDYIVTEPFQTGVTVEAASIQTPANSVLYQNYPNPFNPRTTIRYQIHQAMPVQLTVYNTQGHVVQALVDQMQSAGTYTVEWNAENLTSGTYIYQLKTPAQVEQREMILLK